MSLPQETRPLLKRCLTDASVPAVIKRAKSATVERDSAINDDEEEDEGPGEVKARAQRPFKGEEEEEVKSRIKEEDSSSDSESEDEEKVSGFLQDASNNSKFKMPTFTTVFAAGTRVPDDSEKVAFDKIVHERKTARLLSTQPHTPPAKFSPFIHLLKNEFSESQAIIESNERAISKSRDLTRAGDSSYFDRVANQRGPGESAKRRDAAKICFFHSNQIPTQCLQRLAGKDVKWFDDDPTDFQREVNAWSGKLRGYVFKVMQIGMEGFVAFYGLETFLTFNDTEITSLLLDLFDKAPLIHALAMWAQCDSVDIAGIYGDARHSEAEQRRRECFRASIRYRFVAVAKLCYKYMINANPAQIGKKKPEASDAWKRMCTHDTEYQRLTAAAPDLDDVPVHKVFKRKENLFKI